jgi:hypothetical protein
MRTTIDLPDNVFHRLKVHSANQGISLKKYVTRVIERDLEQSGKKSIKKHTEFPLVHSKHPGTIQLNSEKIAAILEEKNSHVSP